MRLTLEVPAAPVAQGTTLQGRLLADLDGAQLAAAQIELRFAPFAFSGIDVQPEAFAQPNDQFDLNTAGDGTCTIVAVSSAPLSGTLALLSFTAQVDGLRGDVYAIRGSVLSASTPNLIAIEAEPVDATILVASGALGIATTALADAHSGVFYAERIMAEGGQPPYHFTGAGTGSAGLTLDDRGLLSGTPSAASDATWTIGVTDSAAPAASASRTISLRITAPPPTITTAALPDTGPGHDYDVALAAAGGLAPLQWNVTGLPPGLQLQNNRIRGTVALDAGLGSYTVALEVQDGELRPQRARRELTLQVHPIAVVQRIDLASPGALVVARDLLVAEYDIEVWASASSTYQDEATEEILDRALEEVISEIFDLMLEDGVLPGLGGPVGPEEPSLPGDPDDPFGPFPGEPGEEPEPPGPGGRPNPNRERLHELLQLYRWLDDQTDPNVIKFGVIVSVEIDGRFAYSWSNVDLKKVTRKPRRAVARAPLSEKKRALRRDLQRNKKLWARYAIGEVRAAMRRTGRRKPPASMARWRGPARAFFDERLQRLLEAIGERDWNFWIDPPGTVLSLTPGRHRVRLRPTILWALSGDSITGAMEIASATATSRATFRARNPHNWPRLQGELVVQGTCRRGEYIEENVSFPNSALDVVCESGGTLQIVAATGDAAVPYASPRAFAPALGMTPTRLTAGAVDEFGRTWLIASDATRIVIARNRGLGGFARLDPPAIEVAGNAIQQIQVIETSAWGVIAVLLRNRIVALHQLHRVEYNPPQAISASVIGLAVRSDVVHDEAASFVVHRPGTNALFVVVDRYSAQVTRSVVKLAAPFVPANFIPGGQTVELMTNPVAIALDQTDGSARAVVALRQRRQLRWYNLQNGATAGDPHPQVLDLAAPPLGLVAGPGAGQTIQVEPALQLLYRDAATDRVFLVLPEGDATAMHAADDTLAASSPSTSAIIILKDNR